MKLSKLYTNKPTLFTPVKFVAGLNVVIAEIRLPELCGFAGEIPELPEIVNRFAEITERSRSSEFRRIAGSGPCARAPCGESVRPDSR